MFLTIIIFLAVLSILVFVHEVGHFISARRFGVKAEEFGFGFPPRLGGIYRNREGKWKLVWGSRPVEDSPGTVYSFNWIPLGGFVKIKGENGDNSDPDSFVNKKIWKRAIILSAGVFMNIVLAAVLFSIGLSIGMPQALDDINPRAAIRDRSIQIIQVLPDSPAAQAGIQIGDVIENINGEEFTSYQELQKFVDEHTGEELIYKIKRAQAELTEKITPQIIPDTGKGGIGVGIIETGTVKYPFYIAAWEGIKITGIYTWAVTVAFYDFFKGVITGAGVSADLAGPVGIATMTGQVARMGLIYLLQFIAILSINLAIINFIPFPALDGGRVLFLAIEKIKGAPVKREIESLIHNIGFALLMVLVLIVTLKDIAKLGDKFRMFWERIIG